MSELKKLLGQRIKELRKAKGITQEELAEKVGIGTANISYIETGKFAPSIENFEKIANILGVQPYELYLFYPIKTPAEMKEEMFNILEKDVTKLRLVYNFFKSIN